jgi:hypothetical protein
MGTALENDDLPFRVFPAHFGSGTHSRRIAADNH